MPEESEPHNSPIDSHQRHQDIRLDDIRIISTTGTDISIINQISVLELNEDLFANQVTGRLGIVDAINLQNLLPMSGNEYVLISFRTPGLQPNILVMNIDRISERLSSKNQQAQVYDLFLISPAFIINQRVRVSKSFSGKISDIVKSMYAEYIENENIEGNSSLSVEDTFGEIKIIVPNWRPLNAINWLARQAISTTHHKSDYVFYQDMDGHKFVSLTKLFNAPPREIYEVIPGRSSAVRDPDFKELDLDVTHRNIHKYAILAKDHSKEFSDGAFASTTYTHNLVTKSVKSYEYKYRESFDGHTTLNGHPVLPAVNDSFSAWTNAKIFFVPSTTGVYDKGSESSVSYPSNRFSDQWISENPARMALLNDTRMLIEVDGDSNRRVGDKVAVSIPNVTSLETEAYLKYDKFLTGFYIISKLTHLISKMGHTMKMELVKDSNISPIPDTTTFEFDKQNTTGSA